MLSFLSEASDIVAVRLLGYVLEREIDGKIIKLKIVETEAYDETYSASHSYRVKKGYEISNGPAKLCQALDIDDKLNGHDLTESPLKLILQPSIDASLITQTQGVGISQAKSLLWRFFITNNSYVSKK